MAVAFNSKETLPPGLASLCLRLVPSSVSTVYRPRWLGSGPLMRTAPFDPAHAEVACTAHRGTISVVDRPAVQAAQRRKFPCGLTT